MRKGVFVSLPRLTLIPQKLKYHLTIAVRVHTCSAVVQTDMSTYGISHNSPTSMMSVMTSSLISPTYGSKLTTMLSMLPGMYNRVFKNSAPPPLHTGPKWEQLYKMQGSHSLKHETCCCCSCRFTLPNKNRFYPVFRLGYPCWVSFGDLKK